MIDMRERVRDASQRESAGDELGTPRCPKCQWPLQLRYGRHGAAFTCGCKEAVDTNDVAIRICKAA